MPVASSRRGFLRVVDSAVAGGIDVLALGEGYLVDPNYPLWAGGQEPITELAFLAGRHPGVHLLVSASILPLRDAVWLAKQAATLDNLTNGAAVFALAPGYWDKEFEFAGLDFKARGRLFDRNLDRLIAAFDGSLGGGPDRLSPVPHTKPHPELWLAGGPATMAKALRRGLGFISQGATPAALADRANRWFAQGGAKLAAHGPLFPPGEPATAAGVLERLRGFEALGVSTVILIPPEEDNAGLAAVELLTTEVLPAVGGGSG
jgi:alkanesulfonate monooxygenase SsuD/methylene tetrahydromethanopterin reductase-like flavin-dependent oxidoreductase (luciferase family)